MGLGIAGACIYASNKVFQIKIDKKTQTIFVYHILIGRNSLAYNGAIDSPEQFSITEVGKDDSSGNQIGFYDVNFDAPGETIKLSSMIEGERAAQALRDRIVAQIFDENNRRLAA